MTILFSDLNDFAQDDTNNERKYSFTKKNIKPIAELKENNKEIITQWNMILQKNIIIQEKK